MLDRFNSGMNFSEKGRPYEITKIANSTPSNILEKVYTHSFNGYVPYIKSHRLKIYPENCHLEICYICSRE